MRRKTLKELNVMDDFLFHEMITRGEKGEEFCRILLRTILGQEIRNVKVIAQRKVQGRSPNQHGIILDALIEASQDADGQKEADVEVEPDIFDIEPNQYREISEPKRTRYYHALIDARILKSGVHYENMKNVTVIMILPYDPFGKGRMVYTIEKRCKEEPGMDYNDGLHTIFINARSTGKDASQELCDMLKYMQESKAENATNQDLKYIHNLMTEVKEDEEVGVSYMKSWEREEYIRREGRKEGRKEGTIEGRQSLLINLVCRKMQKNYSVPDIAEMLEEEEAEIQRIHDAAVKYAPEYNVEKILEELRQNSL